MFIIPLIVINFIFIMTMTNRMREQISYATNINFQQTLDYLEAYISSYDTLAFNLSRIDDFQDLYRNREQLESLDSNDFFLIRNNLNTKIFTVISRSPNRGVSFYFDRELTILANNETYFRFRDISGEIWFYEMYINFIRNRRSFLVCPPSWSEENSQVVSFARTIFNMNYYWDLIGFVKVDMPIDSIINILKKNITLQDTSSYILNYRQEIVASFHEGNPENLESLLPYRNFTPWYNGEIINLTGKNYMVWQSPIGRYHLNLITLIPVSAITNQSELFAILIIASLLLLSFGASFAFRKEFAFLTKRLQLVIINMQATNNGTLSTVSGEPGKDEAGQLIINYNKMVENLKTMIENNNRHSMELRNYELQILWEQINPHFLYNNLEMINWLSKNGQNEKVSIAVDTLALFYQVALSGGMQKIPLSMELEHVRSYINLQNMRFENVLKYQCESPEDCDSLYVPRTILQPIVENSVIHGVLEKESGMGSIRISINSSADFLIIEIEDDGVGIPEEKTRRLNESLKAGKVGTGYGVVNVAKRIELMYGPAYGLFFKSEYGIGTTVTIRLPLDKNSTTKDSDGYSFSPV